MIMCDKWMNIGYDEDELMPYEEPKVDIDDLGRISE